MTTLGQAYVQIMPSAKGISGSIQKTLNPEATAAGKSAGSRIASSIADSMGSVGKTLTKSITLPVAAVASALAGIGIKKGFDRLLAIDTAKAKLEALGHSAKNVDVIMESALASVKGTSFGLGDAATAAASAVAAGIKPGKELTQYLTNVGDAAAIAGIEFSDMGSIFNKVESGGKATRMELNQMADRGLPVFKWLAEAAGETDDAIQEMVSNGEISSELFNKAVQNNIGGAAQIMGVKSFSAAFANVGAAVGRLGASFLDGQGDGKGFFSQLKPLMADFTENIDNMGDVAQDLGVKFGKVFAELIEKIKNAMTWWNGLDGDTKKLIGTIAGIAVAAGPVLLVLSKLITTITAMGNVFVVVKVAAGVVASAIGAISAPVLIVIGVITGLIALFVTLYKKNEVFRYLVNNAWETIKETIMTVIQAVSDFIMDIWGYLTDWWQENNELYMQTIDTVWSFISGIIQSVMEFLVPYLANAWLSIKTTVEVVWGAIKTVIMIAIDIIMGIIKTVMQVINGDWSGAWETIKDTLISIWDRIKEFLADTVEIIKNNLQDKFEEIKQTIRDKLEGAKQYAIDKFTELKNSAINKVTELLAGVVTNFNEIKTAIKTKISDAKNDAIRIATELVLTVINKFNELKGAVTDSFSNVKKAVSDGINNALDVVTGIKDKFFDAGKNIVGSIADGIREGVGKVTDAIGGVAQKARDFLPFSPPKTGPLKDIMDVKWGETISGGIVKGESVVADAMESLLSPSMNLRGASGVASGQQINNDYLITIHATIKEEQDIKKLVKELDDYLVQKERQQGVVRIR